MPKRLSPEEQQIKTLNSRYEFMQFKYMVLCVGLIALLLFLIPQLTNFLMSWGVEVFMVTCVTIGVFLAVFIRLYMKKKFIEGLDTAERQLIIDIPDETISRFGASIKHTRRVLHKSNPQAEYLRPSLPTESGETLLRAATSTETTPQDQLLRPVQSQDE